MKWRHLLGGFFAEHRCTALIFLLFSGIFAAVFSLYELKAEAVLYAALLCILAASVILGLRFYGYCRQHRRRQELMQNIEVEYDRLPEPLSLAERDYQAMVRLLGQINVKHLTESRAKEQEGIDYYTTWVHQIKAPIAVMRMILQGEDTDEHRELAVELFRIEQYVEMVLTYLRLGSSSTDFVFREYDLDNIIKQAVHKYAPQFVRKRIRLVYGEVHRKVLTDEKWLLFILEQLLSNALKYTYRGTITITAEDHVLKITDTGIGIAPEDLPRIFEKGFTGFNGRADKKSTGLGLYLCKEIAGKLSIGITAESLPGLGSTFMLDLKTGGPEVYGAG